MPPNYEMHVLSNSANAWAPAEDATQLLADRSWLEGGIIASIAYGMDVVLFFMCFYLTYQQTTRQNLKQSITLLAYICIIFILSTIHAQDTVKNTELAFIDNRNFPGGPSAFENVMRRIPASRLGTVADVLQGYICDGILVSLRLNRISYLLMRLPIDMEMYDFL